MTGVIATDLDRTLIFSRNAMGESQFATLGPVCVEIYRDAPLSYMTPRAQAMLTRLTRVAPVVPVTTRTAAQYARITLPGAPFRYAVVSSGGRILRDGVDDSPWRKEVEYRVRSAASLPEVTQALHDRIDDTWVRSSRTADDLFCYIVVERSRQPADFVDEWRDWCTRRGWMVSQQGRKIYALPREVTKSAAMAQVRSYLVDEGTMAPDDAVYAAGDGRLDIDLLEYADAAIRPCHGELEEIGWTRHNLSVTTDPGALAGEQILEWFGERIDANARMGI